MHGRKLPSQYDRCKPDPGPRRRIQESFWAGDTLEWETTLTDPTVFVKPFVERRTLKSRSNYDFTERIENAISDGILAPGSRLLSERELAQRLDASRESVREAYRSLEVAGLLVIRRGKDGGAFVRDVDHGAVTRSLSLMLRLGKTSHRELTEARLLIEPPIARLAAARATRSAIEALE